MKLFNIFNLKKEAEMPETNTIEIEPVDGQCEGRCHNKVNLCNDSVYNWGRIECLQHPYIPLRTAGNTYLGYAVNEGKATYLKVVWKGEANEVLVITRNDRPIEFVHIDETDGGVKCVKLKEKFCDCDVVNILEVPAGCHTPEEVESQIVGEFKPACEISVSLEYEQDCDERFKREGDGVIEAIDTTGTTDVNVGATWFTRTLDTVRNNTLPAYMHFTNAEDAIKLKEGTYKIWYESGIKFDQSVALDYEVKLQESINGGLWQDIPQSGSTDFVLAGDNGNVTAGRMITYKVDRGNIAKIRIQEKISQDTSIETGSAGAGIVIERIKNSIDL